MHINSSFCHHNVSPARHGSSGDKSVTPTRVGKRGRGGRRAINRDTNVNEGVFGRGNAVGGVDLPIDGVGDVTGEPRTRHADDRTVGNQRHLSIGHLGCDSERKAAAARGRAASLPRLLPGVEEMEYDGLGIS